MQRLFSYVIKFDTGAAPNPFWDLCTLTICKPVIRKTANTGDWILGFGASQVKLKEAGFVNYSSKLVYAMKVTEKLTLQEYNDFCLAQFQNKIPVFKTGDWRKRLGDCVYDLSNDKIFQRQSVHDESHTPRDISGIYSLLSDCFYYFGNGAIDIPASLAGLIHQGRGHKIISNETTIDGFERWIDSFKKNKIYGDPQYRHKYDRNYKESSSDCRSPSSC